MRQRFVWDEQSRDFIPFEEYHRRPVSSGPSIISDTVDPFRSHADGQMYDSKRAYRKNLARRGFEEVGNERLDTSPREYRPDRQGIQRAIKDAIEQSSTRR